MNKYVLLFLFGFIVDFLPSIAQTDSILVVNGIRYHSFIVKVDSAELSHFNIVSNTTNTNHRDFISSYEQSHGSNFFAVNACVNDKSGKPLGLFVVNKQEVNHLNLDDGVGNFFMKPNGVLLIQQDDAVITTSEKMPKSTNANYAVQSGPMLIINDTINKAFNINSTNKNLRCGVGVFSEKKQKYLVFLLSDDPVTFFELASAFQSKLHCANALCLESANSVMYSPANADNLATNKVVGNYLFYSDLPVAARSKNIVAMIKSPSGIYELPVELNGVIKLTFILDPGASDLSISPDVALTLMRTGTITDKDYIGTQRYVFADGSTAASSVFNLHQLKIGNYTIKNVRASISGSVNAPMLLGQSALQKFGKFTVNNADHTLTIE